MLDYRTDWCRV